ncbi:MAG: phosphoenolpyruvate--protein phosphotransferase [Propionibacteriaceae bacterium]|jgi:phosphotransferase system enzyme I (PtsI)|nr:phosphoenolpyruvate--protein phosphotransferase [Propionibacteriaceae bacterium]
MRAISGVGVGVGLALGPLVVVAEPPRPPVDEPPCADVAVGAASVREALEAVASELDAMAGLGPDATRAILEAEAMVARDPGLASGVAEELERGSGPATAVFAAVERFAVMFRSLGGHLADRVADLTDVRDRAVAKILDLPAPGVPKLDEPSVLAAVDLAPSDAAALDPRLCLALVTEGGGPTSHTAILAAQLGIPTLVQAVGITAVAPGTTVAVDCAAGQVVVDPDEAERSRCAERARRRVGALSASTAPGATSDGYQVPLLANVGTLEDARSAAAQPVEGVGLLRTEFLFSDRDEPPAFDEQVAAYTEVLLAFAGRPVTARTLDAGADKPLAFSDLGPEPNPALGRRGLRFSMARPDILDTQLAALEAARQATRADLRIMAPMVATQAETQWFVERCRRAGLPKAGVMIEVPAAAIRSRGVFYHADFASLGTNDLSQYTLAADRGQGALAALLSPWEPALLDIVALACHGGQEMGKPVGVCGEAAGDPAMALVLVGLGARSLSMAAARVPAVRTALSRHSRSRCQQLAAAARAAITPDDARQAVLAQVDPVVLDLL